MTKTKKLLRAGIVLLGVGLAAAALWRGLLQPKEPHLEKGDFGPVADFRLTERSGKTVSPADLKGKAWVADFIFTRCGGPCPRLTKTMARLQSSFSNAADVRFVSFTVDPAYDTPAVLSEYADRFGADKDRWLFLTGETAAVREVVMDGFKLAMRENEGLDRRPGEEVVHSLHFVLVDKGGRIRGYFTAVDDKSMDRLRRQLRELA